MAIEPIRNDDDLKKAFRRLEKIFKADDGEGTAQADERDVLVTLVEVYENMHDFGTADPVEAIKFRMEQEGLTPRDLEPCIGPSGRVSEVLHRKRPLSLRTVKRLHDGLKISCESLLTNEWPAPHHGGHGASARDRFRHGAQVLAEPAVRVRHAGRRSGAAREAGAEDPRPSADCGVISTLCRGSGSGCCGQCRERWGPVHQKLCRMPTAKAFGSAFAVPPTAVRDADARSVKSAPWSLSN